MDEIKNRIKQILLSDYNFDREDDFEIKLELSSLELIKLMIKLEIEYDLFLDQDDMLNVNTLTNKIHKNNK
jgi:acyl carrier protein